MPDEDLYGLLGVQRDADAAAVKKAYRKLALKLHPDRNPGDKTAEERFKKINHANEVISDPKKRALYDEFGEAGLRDGFDAERAREYARWQGRNGEQGPDLNDLFGQSGGQGPVDFGTLFGMFNGQGVGGARRGRGASPFGGSMPMRGADLEGEVTVDFVQAVRGGEIALNVNGSPVTVRVPPGATEGSRVRIAAKGAGSPTGGPAGDLLLTVHVREHGAYWMEGSDLHVRVPVTVGEAFHGSRVRVPTPEGDVTVTVPAHAQSGAKLRVRGKGIPKTKKRAATDLIVHLVLMLPSNDSEATKAAVDALEKGYEGDVRAELTL